jgi:hypothetical protein
MLLRTISLVVSLTFAVGIAVITSEEVAAATACDYYASPNGGGNGLSQSSPFRLSNFWSVAGPGETLCLFDGVYTDSINPPQNLNGTASASITIKALNDGAVVIDGQGARRPVALANNDWFILEGFNAKNGTSAVVEIGTGADNNIVRRVCAWDAAVNDNNTVMISFSNTGNLFEDVCAFGTGRKMISNSQNGNNSTVRRAWAMWNESTWDGPAVFSNGYNTTSSIFENVIGTWDGASNPTEGSGGPLSVLRFGPTTYTQYACLNASYLGSIAYVLAGQVVPNNLLAMASNSNDNHCLTMRDVAVFVDATHSTLRPYYLRDDTQFPPSIDNFATRVTEIGGTTSTIQSSWTVTNRIDVDTLGSTDIWDGANQANVCKRYVNGILTTTPLWPWPMNQRIIDAMKAAGKTPVDVTATMGQIFGPIPSRCRADSAPPVAVLISPTNLAVQ